MMGVNIDLGGLFNRSVVGNLIIIIVLLIGGTIAYTQIIREQNNINGLQAQLTEAYVTQTSVANIFLTQTPIVTSTASSSINTTSPSGQLVTIADVVYQTNNLNPRFVKLRTATDTGIPVQIGDRFEFVELWLRAIEGVTNLEVEVEIYVNDEDLPIGVVHRQPLQFGFHAIKNIIMQNFIGDDGKWYIQDDWNTISIVVIPYVNDIPQKTDTIDILLHANGDSWYVEPPTGGIRAMRYSINDGELISADLQNIMVDGLDLNSDDTLTIHEVDYFLNENSVQSVLVEVYFSSNHQFIDATYISTSPQISQYGTRKINISAENLTTRSNTWILQNDFDMLVVQLVRGDSVILDSLVIPLSIVES